MAVGLVIGTRPIAGTSSKPSGCEGRPNVLRMMLIQACGIQSRSITVGVQRISEVAETVLGPAVLVIVDSFLEKDGIAVLIAQEKRVTFGGYCQTVDQSLSARFCVIVVAFNFEDGAGLVRVRIEFHKTCNDDRQRSSRKDPVVNFCVEPLRPAVWITSIPFGSRDDLVRRWSFPMSAAYGKTRTATGSGLISGFRIGLLLWGKLVRFSCSPTIAARAASSESHPAFPACPLTKASLFRSNRGLCLRSPANMRHRLAVDFPLHWSGLVSAIPPGQHSGLRDGH